MFRKIWQAGAIRKSAEPLAIATGEPQRVEQLARARGIVFGEGAVEALMEKRALGRGRSLGGFGEPHEFGLDDVFRG